MQLCSSMAVSLMTSGTACRDRRQPSRLAGPSPRRRRPHQRQMHLPPHATLESASLLLTLATAAYVDPSLAGVTFEPQMRPEIVVAAACAAAPPIIFWARIIRSNQKRMQAADDEQQAEEQRQRDREVLKRKITGQSEDS